MIRIPKEISAGLLVAGTAVGAGMLALPVVTAEGGFWPSCLIYLLCWIFMASTGLLLFEVCLWMPKDVNIVSMAEHLLGRTGKMLGWLLYLFLFYSLTVAYVAGGGGFISAIFGETVPDWLAISIFVLILSPIVYAGTRAVDRLNFILMCGLGISYLIFIIFGFTNVQFSYLEHLDWKAAFLALPIMFTSFSYQGIVPSLSTYLNRNAKKMRRAIFIGTTLPLVIYLIWQLLVLGIVPLEGENGLLFARQEEQSAIIPLREFLHNPFLSSLGQVFAFFALTTSFLGVTLGLTDFLADGFKIEKVGNKKMFLCFAVFLPPTVIAIFNPKIFLSALTYAGGIGCALLLGLMPIVMVWVGRYRGPYGIKRAQLPGGKPLLILLSAFVLFQLLIEFIVAAL